MATDQVTEYRLQVQQKAHDTSTLYMEFFDRARTHPIAQQRMRESLEEKKPLVMGVLGMSLFAGIVGGRLLRHRIKPLVAGPACTLLSLWATSGLTIQALNKRSDEDLLWMISQQNDLSASLLALRPKYPMAKQWTIIDERMAELGINEADVMIHLAPEPEPASTSSASSSPSSSPSPRTAPRTAPRNEERAAPREAERGGWGSEREDETFLRDQSGREMLFTAQQLGWEEDEAREQDPFAPQQRLEEEGWQPWKAGAVDEEAPAEAVTWAELRARNARKS